MVQPTIQQERCYQYRQGIFKLLRLHFPKQHPLHHTVKLSYSCMPSIDSIVKAHNKKYFAKRKETATAGTEPHAQWKTNVVYRATVQYDNKTSHYIGITENSFKTRYTQHKSSLRHSKNRSQTELSSLVWSLKDSSTPYQLFWHIIDNAQPNQPGKRSCNLCLEEKYHILIGKHLVNKKNGASQQVPTS